ncbi:uncharacterized protein LOC104908599 [Beta vulgaris subsp. vulgaris]|uniref:uncharacterized protein LOC104908599 n=1 Tax=Beta vulgaris subsp. vulgaris TaxID=3555 RepID=UPI00053F34F1|nr:uncharacterized protein LOC104908599 [Beta vulgaris subsp. vulgaris]
MGLSPLQKCTAAIRILAYGTSADIVDEYIKIGESTAIECVFRFCRAVIDAFGGLYLRRPTNADVQRLLQMHEEYHGSNNDLNVLSRSNLFQEKLQVNAPEVDFTVNGSQYTMGYYLTDGIYPEWAAFVKSFPHPQDPKRLCFKRKHESARKDVERAFGVLQARFAIVKGPVRCWHKSKIHDIMETCIILHNMIVEDERHTYSRNFQDNKFVPQVVGDIQQGHVPDFQAYLATDATIRDRNMHHQLKADLVEHIWTRFGSKDLN